MPVEIAIAVVLPAYNEELTIAQAITEFVEALPEARIVVVDNNSEDSTAQIAQQTFRTLCTTGIFLREGRQGKGNAVRRAFAAVDADIYVLCDADLTYPAHRVRDLIAPIAAGDADMTVGDRRSGGDYEARNKRRFHTFGNELVRRLVNTLFGAKLIDIMSGYRVLTADFAMNYPVLAEGFQLETDMTLHALDKRYRIVEIPVEYKDRPAGSVSKLNTISDGARVLFAIFKILSYYRPLLFFGGVAVFFAAMGVIVAAPVLDDWFTYHYIYHVPLAILAAALEAVATTCLGIGLILTSINYHFRLLFEQARTRRVTVN